MGEALQVRDIKPFSKEWSLAKGLMKRTFEPDAQAPLLMLRFVGRRNNGWFEAFYDDDLFCGFTCVFHLETCYYVLYMVVNDEIRSQGYGTRIANILKGWAGDQPIVVDIQPLDETAENSQERADRVRFYVNNGFQDTGIVMREGDGEYQMVLSTKPVTVEELETGFRKWSHGFFNPEFRQD